MASALQYSNHDSEFDSISELIRAIDSWRHTTICWPLATGNDITQLNNLYPLIILNNEYIIRPNQTSDHDLATPIATKASILPPQQPPLTNHLSFSLPHNSDFIRKKGEAKFSNNWIFRTPFERSLPWHLRNQSVVLQRPLIRRKIESSVGEVQPNTAEESSVGEVEPNTVEESSIGEVRPN